MAGSAKMWRTLAHAEPYWRALPPALAATLPTPSLVVFMDVVRDNIARMVQRTGGPERWRPHLKTTKLRPVWAALLDAGVRSFKCATVREASLLLDVASERGVAGVDLLVNHQSAANVRRLAEAAAPHAGRARVSVLVEAAETAAAVPRGLGIWLDLNPAGGPDPSSADGAFDRTGCMASDHAAISAAVREAGERFGGVHWCGTAAASLPSRAARAPAPPSCPSCPLIPPLMPPSQPAATAQVRRAQPSALHLRGAARAAAQPAA